jgi:hypothetical protein
LRRACLHGCAFSRKEANLFPKPLTMGEPIADNAHKERFSNPVSPARRTGQQRALFRNSISLQRSVFGEIVCA